jgi:multiple sugar transport system substrate-binding protein
VEVEVEKVVTVPPEEREPVSLEAHIAFTQADYGLQFQVIEQWRDIFQETYPWITVNLAFNDWTEHHNKMLVLAAANELPDFIEVQASRSLLWIIEGVFLPIDDFAAADAKFDMDDFFAPIMEYYRWEGQTYSLPYDHGPEILGYNKSMFDEFGESYPDETWTYETLLEKATIFTTEDTWGYSGMPRSWLLEPNYLMPWGGLLFNEDETECVITMPESIEALKWWLDLQFVHGVAPTPAQSEVLAAAGGDFVSGKVAMVTAPPWSAPTWNALGDFAWDVAPWPEGPVARTCAGLGSGYGITKDTASPEDAWRWLAWMTSTEGLSFVWAVTGASTPPRKSVFDVYLTASGVAPGAQYFYDAMNDYMKIGRPVSPYGGEFTAIRNREIDLMLTGAKSVEEACADMKADGDPILAQNAELYG